MMTRREAISKVVILTIASLCAVLVGAAEAADFDWGRFKGKDVTLRMIDQKRTWSTLVGGWLPEFEALTGIKVQLDVPYGQGIQSAGQKYPVSERSVSGRRSRRMSEIGRKVLPAGAETALTGLLGRGGLVHPKRR
jgi:hypothetical protein